MSQIEQICDRSIWIYDGRIREEGKTKIVDQHYYQYMETERLNRIESEFLKNIGDKDSGNKIVALKKEKDQENYLEDQVPAFARKNAIHKGGRKVRITNIKLYNSKLEESIVFGSNDVINLEMHILSELRDV